MASEAIPYSRHLSRIAPFRRKRSPRLPRICAPNNMPKRLALNTGPITARFMCHCRTLHGAAYAASTYPSENITRNEIKFMPRPKRPILCSSTSRVMLMVCGFSVGIIFIPKTRNARKRSAHLQAAIRAPQERQLKISRDIPCESKMFTNRTRSKSRCVGTNTPAID